MSNLKPFLVTSRYGNFNDYIKTRFSKLIEDKFSLENESTNMCICPSCEGYCNTLNKKECDKLFEISRNIVDASNVNNLVNLLSNINSDR